MMTRESFRTVFPVRPAAWDISYADRILLLGSCFSTHIGQRLVRGKFKALINPGGILFNPASIARTLMLLAGREDWDESRLVLRNDSWLSWDHQSNFRDKDPGALKKQIEHQLAEAKAWTAQTNTLILTLGTALAYYEKARGLVVSNCHKLPASAFERKALGVDECTLMLSEAFDALTLVNPDIRIILTVSPVRHTREGMVENQRSKAVLLLTCAELEQRYRQLSYFPAYELLMDDLRDYRFYASDMIHPSEQAIEYIWQAFRGSYFSAETETLLSQAEAIQREIDHKPSDPDSAENQARMEILRAKDAALDKLLEGKI